MNKKQTFLLVVLILLTLGITGACVYQYSHHQNVTNAAVAKAQKQRNTAQSEAATLQLNLQAAQSQVQDVTAKKVAACNALVAHKLTDLACK